MLPYENLLRELDPAALVITVNQRLAKHLRKLYAQKQIESGNSAWIKPQIETLNIILQQLIKRLCHEFALPQAYFKTSALQEKIIWHLLLNKFSSQANFSAHQISNSKIADDLRSAWDLIRSSKISCAEIDLYTNEEWTFLKFMAGCYQDFCQEKKILDNIGVLEILLTISEQQYQKLIPARKIFLVGFSEISPLVQSWLDKLAEYKNLSYYHAPFLTQTEIVRHEYADLDQEIRSAAKWAQHEVKQNPQVSIGIVGCELHANKTLIELIFSEYFADHSYFDCSLGSPLSNTAVAKVALLFLKLLITKKITNNAAYFLIPAPYLNQASKNLNLRHQIILELKNLGQTDFTFEDICKIGKNYDPELIDFLGKQVLFYKNQKVTQYPSQWLEIFVSSLTQAGWPNGEQGLFSEEKQAADKILSTLNEFSKLDYILGRINNYTALQYLELVLKNTVFHASNDSASIQIMGYLEASEFHFDKIWWLGLNDNIWPPPSDPNPFIPRPIQYQYNLPHASREREMNYVEEITHKIFNRSPEVHLSYAKFDGDTALAPSPLITEIELKKLEIPSLLTPDEKIFASRPDLVRYHDDEAEKLNSPKIKGGTTALKLQAICPFRAFAETRLDLKKQNDFAQGFSALNVGNIIHKILELFWRKTKNQAELNKISAQNLALILEKLWDQALEELNYSAHHSNFKQLQKNNLLQLCHEWLEMEKLRPPFTVHALEYLQEVEIADLKFNIKIDRIDRLADGSYILIDYKTGKNVSINSWFDERLEDPQLPIYATQQNVSGLYLAKINQEKLQFIGVGEEKHFPNTKKIENFSNLLDEWKHKLEKLSLEYQNGKAKVDPKKISLSCRTCHLHNFCRIYEKKT